MEEIKAILAVASAHGVLTKEVERDLIFRAQHNDASARTLLVKHNYRLIISVAKKFQNRGLPFEDLVQEGSLGLLRAVDKFDLSRGLKLSTYATQWIRQFINRAIENKAKIIRVPIHMLSRITNLKRAYRKYVEETQEIPSSEEIAAICNITQAEAEELGRYCEEPKSLDSPVSTGKDLSSDAQTVMDYIADESSFAHTDEEVETNWNEQQLNAAIRTLSEEEQVFIIHKWGLVDYRVRTDAEVANDFQTTVEDIKILESIILNKLRSCQQLESVNLERGVSTKLFKLIIVSVPTGVLLLKALTLIKKTTKKAAELGCLPVTVLDDVSYEEAQELSKKLSELEVITRIVSRT